MDIICDSNELDLFNCDVVQDLIHFKWSNLGKRWHLIGCFFHFFYMGILMYYINIVYVLNLIEFKPDPDFPEGGGTFNKQTVDRYSVFLMIGIVYSTIYDIT